MFLFYLFILFISVNCHNVHKEKTTVSSFSEHDNENHLKFDQNALFRSNAEEINDLSPEEAKKRLKKLFTDGKLDDNSDGKIVVNELKKWILDSMNSIIIEDSLDQFKEEDENEDGKISWDEHYKNNFNVEYENLDDKEMIYEDKQLWAKADLNNDSFLDKDEFAPFTSPENFPLFHELLYELTMNKRDKNKDGVLSFNEYISTDKNTVVDSKSEEFVVDKEKFNNELDMNKNGVLEKEEVLKWIIPDDEQTAYEEAQHLIDVCDDNKDGYLTIDEILNNYEVFASSEATDYGEKLKTVYHDEL